MSPELFSRTAEPHHLSIASSRIYAHNVLGTMHYKKLSKAKEVAIKADIRHKELQKTYKNVNFSRIQIPAILDQLENDILVAFETLGPYIADYATTDGVMTLDTLTPEDAIGLKLAKFFRELFPNGRFISLYDDYHVRKATQREEKHPSDGFSPTIKRNFRKSFALLLRDQGVILPMHENAKDFRLISESSKQADARRLVKRLDSYGYIRYDGEAMVFVNNDAENPLYRHIYLRSHSGKWLCEALDAASFLAQRNLAAIHIVVLPDYMREQQDKVWEILRILGIQPARYHNIFFDASESADDIVDKIATAFALMGVRPRHL